MSNKNILIISHFYPYAPVSGTAIRIFNMVEDLSSYFNIYFMSFIDIRPSSDEDKLKDLCKETIFVERNTLKKNFVKKILQKIIRCLRIAFLFKNPTIEEHNSTRLKNILAEYFLNHDVDLVIIESSWMAQYIPLIKYKSPSCKVVLDLYDINSQLMKERIPFADNIFSKFYRWFLYFTMEDFEKKYIRMADAVLVVSKLEKEKAKELSPGSNFIEMPNYISLKRYEGYKSYEVVKNSLIFTGWIAAFFNESAVIYFYKDILPLIRKKGLDPLLYIIGGYPARKIRNLAKKDPKIIVTGFVKDVRPFIANSEVFIVPNLEGSGTRIKILEAFAMRKPVVSTPKGCEGLEVKDDENILIRHRAEEFADAVIRLIRDDNLKHRLVENGYELVKRCYSSELCGKHLINILQNILD